jgi:PAS domain S-box-containing protein
MRAMMRTAQAETRIEQAIRDSEMRYRKLFETARDGILILDVDTGRITDVNLFLVRLLDFSYGEIIGRTVGELSQLNIRQSRS